MEQKLKQSEFKRIEISNDDDLFDFLENNYERMDTEPLQKLLSAYFDQPMFFIERPPKGFFMELVREYPGRLAKKQKLPIFILSNAPR